LAYRDAAAPGGEAQPALEGLLLDAGQRAALAARGDARAPLEAAQLARLHDEREVRRVAGIGGVAAEARAVRVKRREFLAELEALALLSARRVARALEHARAPRPAQLARGRAAEEDRRGAFAQRRHADLGARLALEEATRERRQHDVLAGQPPAAVGVLRAVKDEQRGPAAELAAELARAFLPMGCQRQQREKKREPHSGVSFGTRVC